MKNFIFKSSAEGFGLIKNVFLKLETIQAEQRHARNDLALILSYCKTLQHDKNLQNTVDKYFERDETSPQTDTEEQSSDYRHE